MTAAQANTPHVRKRVAIVVEENSVKILPGAVNAISSGRGHSKLTCFALRDRSDPS